MNVIDWINQGDIFISYLSGKDLCNLRKEDVDSLRSKILVKGFGYILLEKMDKNTHLWGNGVYSPKYTSTHYTLLELCELGVDLSDERFVKPIEILLSHMWINKGQVRSYRHQDMCVVAMMLRITSQAKLKDKRMEEMLDYILDNQMSDGGWNCAWERKPFPKQSSLHTTISVLEAFATYLENGYKYRIKEILAKIPQGAEYVLTKKLFRSVTTGEVIHKDMLNLPFPYGWKYDILRALYVMATLKITYDTRMEEALNLIIMKLDNYGRIKASPLSTGKHHFIYTRTNKLCPYNTYRALCVLKEYKNKLYNDYLNKTIV